MPHEDSADLIAVSFGGEETVELGRIDKFNPADPAFAERLSIDQGGIAGESRIGFQDLTIDGGINITGGLDRFDDGNDLSRPQRASRFGRIDEDDVGQFMLGVVGDAESGRPVIGGAEPFVGGGVAEVVGHIHALR